MIGDEYCMETEGYIPNLFVSINGHILAYVLYVSVFVMVVGAS